MRRFHLALFLILAAGYAAADPIPPGLAPMAKPALVNGVLDLRGWDFPDGLTVSFLAGYEYYPGLLLYPEDFRDTSLLPEPEYIGNPMSFPLDSSGQPFGFGTFRAVVYVEPGKMYALEIMNQDTAHRFYLDDVLIASDGTLSETASEGRPSRKTSYYYWTPQTERFEILIQISNYHHYKGGMSNRTRISSPTIMTLRRELTLAISFSVLGAFVLMSFFFMSSFFFMRNTPFNLWIGLLSLIFSIRSLCTGQVDITLLLPNTSWAVITRLGFWTEAAMLPLFVLYLRSLFPSLLPRPVFIGYLVLSAVQMATVSGMVPLVFYAKYLHFPFVYIYFISTFLFALRLFWIARKETWYAFWYGLLCLCFTLIIIDANLIFSFLPEIRYDLSNLGFVFFLFSQAILLAFHSAKAFRERDLLMDSLDKQVLARTAELKKTNAKLHHRNKERDFFLASLSHDVRTPITIILNYINRALKKYPDDNELSLVRDNLNKVLYDMVNAFDFLRLGKSGAFFSEKTVLSVAAELAVLREFYRNAFAQAGIGISVSCPDDLQTLMNRKSFSRICSNYLENELRHAEPGSSVWVEALELSRDEIIVRVENDSPLLYTDDPEGLFKPFVSFRPEKGGAGLGLAIVARLARLSDGRAGYTHRLERNSFYVVLPQCHPETTAPAGAQLPASAGAEVKAETGAVETDADFGDSNLLILVVEDSQEIRAMFVEMLHPKYLVKLASDGREALNLLHAGLNLILSDIMMADMDGFALLSELDRAAAPDESPVPFLFVTAMTSAAEKMPATQRPVRICTKPFTEEQIMWHIRELVK